jgi:RNA polymerase sigma-70 factor (ECF subfamily)
MSLDGSREALEAIVRGEAGRVLASLIASFGDFDLAEDALQDAVAAALEGWPRDGVPQRPAAWLTVAARRRAIDRLRHAAMHADKAEALRAGEELRRTEITSQEADESLPDERLRLLFTCCHPALAPEARVALTLRTLGGLSTEAVARAFLLPVTTLAKRLERAKRKIQGAHIPYRVPPESEWAQRLGSVLAVLYLIFNEGYSATETEPERAGRRASAPAELSCRSTSRIARSGATTSSPWGSQPCARQRHAGSAGDTRSRPPSQPRTPWRRAQPRRPGTRWRRSTRSWRGSCPRRSCA